MRGKEKQLTFLVTAESEQEKQKFIDSSLCMIRDINMGWFDVPASMHQEFYSLFNKEGTENSVCSSAITKEEIRAYNMRLCSYKWRKNYEY